MSDAIDLIFFPSIIAVLLVCVYAHVLFPRENLDAVTAPTSEKLLPPSTISPKKQTGKKSQSTASSTPGKSNAEVALAPEKGAVTTITPLSPLFAVPSFPILPPTTPALLKALNLCVLGVVVSVLAVANFGLAAVIAALAVAPLCSAPVGLYQEAKAAAGEEVGVAESGQAQPVGWSKKELTIFKTTITAGGVLLFTRRLLAAGSVLLISPAGLLTVAARYCNTVPTRTALVEWIRRMMWESVVLKTWFLPLVCVLYLPLVLQSLLVCLLPA